LETPGYGTPENPFQGLKKLKNIGFQPFRVVSRVKGTPAALMREVARAAGSRYNQPYPAARLPQGHPR
jgi:hypothetical protein